MSDQLDIGTQLMLARLERRKQFWSGLGLVIGGILIMLGNREGT